MNETNTRKTACTYGLIRKIAREDLIMQSGYEVYELLADYTRSNYPEFTADDVDDCVLYAMQSEILGLVAEED